MGGEREGGRERGREGMKEGEKEGEEKENERRKRGGKGERGMVNKVYYALVEVSSLYITTLCGCTPTNIVWMHTHQHCVDAHPPLSSPP